MGYSTSFGMLVWGTCSCFQIFQRNSKKPSCRLDPPNGAGVSVSRVELTSDFACFDVSCNVTGSCPKPLVPKRHLRAFSDLTASRELF